MFVENILYNENNWYIRLLNAASDISIVKCIKTLLRDLKQLSSRNICIIITNNMLYVNSYLYPICCVFSILFIFSQLQKKLFFIMEDRGFKALSHIEKNSMTLVLVYKKIPKSVNFFLCFFKNITNERIAMSIFFPAFFCVTMIMHG